MICTVNIGSTTLGYTAIAQSTRLSRRQRESEAVRAILAHLGVNPDSLSHDPEGAPRLPHSFISISHSAKLAVAAIDRQRPVGIDAEEPRPQLHRVKTKFLSQNELISFISLPSLLAAWTIKEAVYKIAGPAAADFRRSIAVDPDLSHACALGRSFIVHALDVNETHISLAVPL